MSIGDAGIHDAVPPEVDATEDLRLAGPRVRLRKVTASDRHPLREILGQREVARWWGPGTPDHAVDEWLSIDDSVVLAIELEGRVIGSIQFAEETDPDYRHAAIDLFLDREHHGLGLGREALRVLAAYLFDARGHHRLTIDPSASNDRAIRTYEAVGFRRVGVMRSYERGADGTWHDGLLLDLLFGELR
jgi:aminoglycoside 6'-N-acetyltransferase